MKTTIIFGLVIALMFISFIYGPSTETTRRELLERGYNETISSYIQAAAAGDLSALQVFSTTSLDINNVNNKGITPLMYAAKKGKNAAVSILIAQGANVNAMSDEGWTPLLFATTSAKHAVMRTLIKNGASVNLASSRTGRVPLHRAVELIDRDAITLLLENGAEPNIKNSIGVSPFLESCKHRTVGIVELLYSHGGDINTTSNTNENCATLSARNNSYKTLAFAYKKNPQIIDHSNMLGMSPLTIAVRFGRTECFNFLINKTQHINNLDSLLNTPIMHGVYNNRVSFVKQLKERGAHLKQVNKKGESVFHMAKRNSLIPGNGYVDKRKRETGIKMLAWLNTIRNNQ